MCSKCYQMQNSFMSRYGNIIKAYQNGNLESAKECQENLKNNREEEVCQEYQNNIRYGKPSNK